MLIRLANFMRHLIRANLPRNENKICRRKASYLEVIEGAVLLVLLKVSLIFINEFITVPIQTTT